ncbi:uncharacterized protein VTP21DRAFT_7436 [Calcarisporiella thermophila]|uniref:uncharacterized protein n=1 Tax=Calcarisporiella thermophila TaxID=911321 RepID=UPI003742B069
MQLTSGRDNVASKAEKCDRIAEGSVLERRPKKLNALPSMPETDVQRLFKGPFSTISMECFKLAVLAWPEGVVYKHKKTGEPVPYRVAFITTKKEVSKSAVVRHRAGRRVREAARLFFPNLAREAHDFFFFVKRSALSAEWTELVESMRKALLDPKLYGRKKKSSVIVTRGEAGPLPMATSTRNRKREMSLAVGNTPLIALNFETESSIEILAKLEYQNPSGSIKDRIARWVLNDLHAKGKLSPDATYIISTNGNFGISVTLQLSRLLRPANKHKVICVVPERTSTDAVRILKTLGVEIVRTPNEARPDANEGSAAVAYRLAQQFRNVVVLDENKCCGFVEAYKQLADEIYEQCDGKLDKLYVGVSTGGTISGLATLLKEKIPDLQVVGVEPAGSKIGENGGSSSQQQFHGGAPISNWKVEDIGSLFEPPCLRREVVDTWVKVSDKDAYSMARRLIREEGLLAGPSSGAVVSAALNSTQQSASRVVVVFNDSARNYTGTLLSDEWMLSEDLMAESMARTIAYLESERYRAASVEDLQLPPAVTVSPTSTLAHAHDTMMEREFSQLPVLDADRKLVGYISLDTIATHLSDGSASPTDEVSKWMISFHKRGRGGQKREYTVITPDTPLSQLAKFLEHHSFAVVTDSYDVRWCLGIVTKFDLLTFLNRRGGM